MDNFSYLEFFSMCVVNTLLCFQICSPLDHSEVSEESSESLSNSPEIPELAVQGLDIYDKILSAECTKLTKFHQI